jgi:hypothetical protein
MANSEHLAKLREGVEAWNRWRMHLGNQLLVPDLIGADLSGADLVGANLHSTNLKDARLGSAQLVNAHLFMTDLSSADLTEANLMYAHLPYADLTDAMLKGANLTGTSFVAAKLDGAALWGCLLNGANLTQTSVERADFRHATVGWTAFGGLDLRASIGLDEMNHLGPSSIGVDTILKSGGNIPDAFLRGAGVPDDFITFARSLVGHPIEFYSCFISYSSKDQGFAERLHADLQAQKLRVWFAPEDLKIGDRFQERIEESIRLYDKVMIVLSEASVQSRWVEREVNAAREREERENRTVLFPIRIDEAVMSAPQPWAADIRRGRHIGDFTGWKDHDSYQKALQRLLRDLAPGPTAER